MFLRALAENLGKFEAQYGEIALPTNLADQLFRMSKILLLLSGANEHLNEGKFEHASDRAIRSLPESRAKTAASEKRLYPGGIGRGGHPVCRLEFGTFGVESKRSQEFVGQPLDCQLESPGGRSLDFGKS